mmetsp:Transcript_6595/g.16435  ORF Transcript_6595/g.16435 Transcript_6595/m.16435 type:complete len:437 (-) Transcript_6595:174-1484(-)
MANPLRPWSVFRKVRYAASAAELEGSVATRMTHKLTNALIHEKVGNTKKPKVDFKQVLAIVGVPSVVAWIGLFGCRQWLSKRDELPADELAQVLGSRVVAHVGPYLLPELVRLNMHGRALDNLADPLLIPARKTACWVAIEEVTQRRAALRATSRELGAKLWWPLFEELAKDPERGFKDVSYFEPQLRAVMDVACGLPAEQRQVPEGWFDRLLQTNDMYFGEPMMEEYRATMFARFLANPDNCRQARGSEMVLAYLGQGGEKQDYDTFWPIKKLLYGGEMHDLLRIGSRFLNLHCKDQPPVEVQPEAKRVLPSLEARLDLRNTQQILMWGGYYAFFRAYVSEKQLTLAVLERTVWTGLRASRGLAMLEALYHLEEHVIQMEWYYHSEMAMLQASAAMTAVHSVVAAWVFATHRFTVLPFVTTRLMKDTAYDAFRFT